jgi:site-specific DNA-cytosine methylase
MSKVDLQVEHACSVESDPFKAKYILQAHRDVQHLFNDVEVFETGWGYCYKCDKNHNLRDIGEIDIFACGPSCKDLSKRNATPMPECYEASSSSKGSSGPTYKKGFQKAVAKLEPKVLFYENVQAVLQKSAAGQRPPIDVVKEDMKAAGYIFAYTTTDSQNFLVL